MFEFSNLTWKCSSNFKSIGWKVRILEILAQIGPLAYFDILAYVDLKINRWLNSLTWYVNHFQISSQSDENWGFRKFGPNWPFLTFWSMFTSKLIGFWIHRPDMKMVFRLHVNRMKIEDFRKFGPNWPIGLCRHFGLCLPQN